MVANLYICKSAWYFAVWWCWWLKTYKMKNLPKVKITQLQLYLLKNYQRLFSVLYKTPKMILLPCNQYLLSEVRLGLSSGSYHWYCHDQNFEFFCFFTYSWPIKTYLGLFTFGSSSKKCHSLRLNLTYPFRISLSLQYAQPILSWACCRIHHYFQHAFGLCLNSIILLY